MLTSLFNNLLAVLAAAVELTEVPFSELAPRVQGLGGVSAEAVVIRSAAARLSALGVALRAVRAGGDELCATAKALLPDDAHIRMKRGGRGNASLFVFGDDRGAGHAAQRVSLGALCAHLKSSDIVYVRHAIASSATFDGDALLAEAAADGAERRVSGANLWLSTGGVRVQAHYDLHANFYVQLHGLKRVALAPPTAIRALQMFPGTTPTARQSRRSRDLADDRFWRDVTLAPGDILLIPPFWVHHVEVDGGAARAAGDGECDAGRRGDRGGAASLSLWWDDGGAVGALRALMQSALDAPEDGVALYIATSRWRDADALALALTSIVRAVVRGALADASHAARAALWSESAGRHASTAAGAPPPEPAALRAASRRAALSAAQEASARGTLRFARKGVARLAAALRSAASERLRNAELLDFVDFALRSGGDAAPGDERGGRRAAFIARVFAAP